MNKLLPLTDWSLESMRPALTVIIRRIDKLFSKIHKSVKVNLKVVCVALIQALLLITQLLFATKVPLLVI